MMRKKQPIEVRVKSPFYWVKKAVKTAMLALFLLFAFKINGFEADSAILVAIGYRAIKTALTFLYIKVKKDIKTAAEEKKGRTNIAV